jgi:hypothetical protein
MRLVVGCISIIAKRFEKRKNCFRPQKQKIAYTPESITISFVSANPAKRDGETQNPAPHLRGGAKPSPQTFSADRRNAENEFVSLNLAPELKSSQTFTITLPNLIHKSKKRNLK